MTLPSREFFVRQAIINWVLLEYPASLKAMGLVACLEWIFEANLYHGIKPTVTVPYIQREFRKLVLKFDSAEVSYCK